MKCYNTIPLFSPSCASSTSSCQHNPVSQFKFMYKPQYKRVSWTSCTSKCRLTSDALRQIQLTRRFLVIVAVGRQAITLCILCHWLSYRLQHSTVQYSTAQYSTAQYSTVQYSTAQHNTVQYSTVQYSTAQHSTAQHSTVQYSAVQYSTHLHTIST